MDKYRIIKLIKDHISKSDAKENTEEEIRDVFETLMKDKSYRVEIRIYKLWQLHEAIQSAIIYELDNLIDIEKVKNETHREELKKCINEQDHTQGITDEALEAIRSVFEVIVEDINSTYLKKGARKLWDFLYRLNTLTTSKEMRSPEERAQET